MGKSMMMTHFMLDTIDKNKETGEVPVFVLLRDYNPEAGDLIDFIFGELKRHDVDLHLSDLVELLQSGKGVILFDGLDEIKSENCRRFYKEMENLADSYPEASYIVSSRPTMNFRGLSRFTVYDLQPFSQEQAVEMVGKLDQSVVDPIIQKDFIMDLRNNRFGFDWRERKDFLGNPLFLTILLLAYEGNHDIPTERYLFYEQAYDAMAKKHDAAKALTREFATGLNSREFQNYFGEFCTITYEQEKYDFTPEEISAYFQEVIEANELDTTPEAFIEDVTGKICLSIRMVGSIILYIGLFRSILWRISFQGSWNRGMVLCWIFFREGIPLIMTVWFCQCFMAWNQRKQNCASLFRFWKRFSVVRMRKVSTVISCNFFIRLSAMSREK